MNVLHLDEQRTWRGGEQQASCLIRGLADRGHRIFIAGRPQSAWLENEHEGSDIGRIPLPFKHEFHLGTAASLARLIRKENIEIIHAHTSHAHSMACFARRLAGRGKVVVSRRVSYVPKANLFNRWKYAWPDFYIAVSQNVNDVLAEYGIPTEKRACVYSSLDLERVMVEPLPRSVLGVHDGAKLLVSAGALTHQKDHENLLLAMPKVIEAFPDTCLLIAGKGELRGALEAKIAEMKLNDCVLLLGHRNDVPALIRTADLYVSPSWSEGLGTSVLEALACKTPVVATDAGGVSEMIRDITGYLVPCKNPEVLARAIIEALTHYEDARKRAHMGRKHVEANFTVTKMVEGTIAVYRKLLGLATDLESGIDLPGSHYLSIEELKRKLEATEAEDEDHYDDEDDENDEDNMPESEEDIDADEEKE